MPQYSLQRRGLEILSEWLPQLPPQHKAFVAAATASALRHLNRDINWSFGSALLTNSAIGAGGAALMTATTAATLPPLAPFMAGAGTIGAAVYAAMQTIQGFRDSRLREVGWDLLEETLDGILDGDDDRHNCRAFAYAWPTFLLECNEGHFDEPTDDGTTRREWLVSHFLLNSNMAEFQARDGLPEQRPEAILAFAEAYGALADLLPSLQDSAIPPAQQPTEWICARAMTGLAGFASHAQATLDLVEQMPDPTREEREEAKQEILKACALVWMPLLKASSEMRHDVPDPSLVDPAWQVTSVLRRFLRCAKDVLGNSPVPPSLLPSLAALAGKFEGESDSFTWFDPSSPMERIRESKALLRDELASFMKETGTTYLHDTLNQIEVQAAELEGQKRKQHLNSFSLSRCITALQDLGRGWGTVEAVNIKQQFRDLIDASPDDLLNVLVVLTKGLASYRAQNEAANRITGATMPNADDVIQWSDELLLNGMTKQLRRIAAMPNPLHFGAEEGELESALGRRLEARFLPADVPEHYKWVALEALSRNFGKQDLGALNLAIVPMLQGFIANEPRLPQDVHGRIWLSLRQASNNMTTTQRTWLWTCKPEDIPPPGPDSADYVDWAAATLQDLPVTNEGAHLLRHTDGRVNVDLISLILENLDRS